MIRVAVDGLGRSTLLVEVSPRTHDKSSTAALLMVVHPSLEDIISFRVVRLGAVIRLLLLLQCS